MGRQLIDLTDKKFTRWTVIKFSHRRTKNKTHRYYWDCRCTCGVKRKVNSDLLKRGQSKSCGCLSIELSKNMVKHNMCNTRTYKSWQKMLSRCTNSNDDSYKYYGDRGIKVCTRWLNSFEKFLEDMNERPEGMTLDRKDNDKGYSPENCRWATPLEQARNKRNNVLIEHNGQTKTIGEWTTIAGLSHGAVRARIKLGWSIKEAIETPLYGRRRRSHEA